MRLAILCLALVAVTLAFNPNPLADWNQLGRASGLKPVNIQFALHQYNLDVLDSEFWAVNDPNSDRYGQFLTKSEVLAIVSPPVSEQEAVVKYLRSQGASKIENLGDSIKATLTVAQIEQLFSCEMHNYVHVSGHKHIAAMSFYMPTDIAPYVEFVTGIGNFPVMKKTKVHPKDSGAPLNDGTYVVPNTLYNIYNYDGLAVTSDNSSLALQEFIDYGSYVPSALEFFQKQNNLEVNSFASDHVVGQFQPSPGALESNLDVQYGLSSARKVTGWYWTNEGWLYPFAVTLFSHPTPPLVSSLSWGWSEDDQCMPGIGNCTGLTNQTYVDRVNVEFQKCGTIGLTIVVCTQDEGAPGSTNPYCDNDVTPLNPSFPASSPYVLAVGATMLQEASAFAPGSPESQAPICQGQYSCANGGTEVACTYPDALITSGGGFSNYASTPTWQQSVVESYLANKSMTFPPQQYFNAKGRAAPDVSALGHNYIISPSPGKNSYEIVDGTSCSTPVFAGIVALMNSERQNAGKAAVGFVTPLLYQIAAANSDAFNDITNGNNYCTEECCASYGYTTAKGWDPVTGLGTPNVNNLVPLVVSAGRAPRN